MMKVVLVWAVALASLGLLASGLEVDQPKRRRKVRRKVLKKTGGEEEEVLSPLDFQTPDPLKAQPSEVHSGSCLNLAGLFAW